MCFADIVSLSKWAQVLRDHGLQPSSDSADIDRLIVRTGANVITREQTRQSNGRRYFLARVVLHGHIEFPAGLSQDPNDARRLAYRYMLDVCTHEPGVKMKVSTAGRVKVTKRPKRDVPLDGKTLSPVCWTASLDVSFVQALAFHWPISRRYFLDAIFLLLVSLVFEINK